ncbi:MAG: hypothetical protein CL917_07685 [Deltaproteobacteria bacterium]|nr:hypothetical protein [Deltaproteobacteria bacterium]
MYGPDFAINWVGVYFDPEELCARHDAGVSPQELVRWPEVAPRGAENLSVSYLGRLHAMLARLGARRT